MESDSKNILLNYVQDKRGELDIQQFTTLLATDGVDINAKDNQEKTVLHHLVCGGGTFEYVKLLIKKEAGITIKDADGQMPLHIVVKEKNQDQLLFLLVLEHFNQESLPEDLQSDPKIKSIIDLFEFEFAEDSKCGKIFKKLLENYFTFDDLEKDEIDFLNDIKTLNAKHSKYQDSSSSSDSGSESDSEDYLKDFSKLDMENNLEMINIFRNFIGNFAAQITEKHTLEHSKILNQEKKSDPNSATHPISESATTLARQAENEIGN